MRLLATLFLLISLPLVAHAPIKVFVVPPKTRVVERLFQALSLIEHCMKWNNPGCLKFAGQAGAVENDLGYAVFRRLEQGELALRRRILRGRGLRVDLFLKRYNPEHADTYPTKVLQQAKLHPWERIE
jgi:hypothetical protein